MEQSPECAQESERLRRVDELLRTAVCERTRSSISAGLDGELTELESMRVRKHVQHCASCRAFQAETARSANALRRAERESPWAETETYELRLGFDELSLIYKSLQAAKTLGTLLPQNELLDDTMLLVDQALKRAV